MTNSGRYPHGDLAYSELPLELLADPRLRRRVHERGGEKEVRFLDRHTPRLLPAWHEGQLHVVRWGYRRDQSRALPATAWT